jgi:hypothetical protein
MMTELGSLLADKTDEIHAIGEAVRDNDRGKVVDGITGLAVTLATQNPLLGALVPFARAGVAKAFGVATDELLRRELAVLEKEEERRELIAQLDAVLTTALGQAVVQLVRTQHQVKQELLDAVGGLRSDFEPFRQCFQASLGADAAPAVELEQQLVEHGALGVRVRAETTRRVVIRSQRVTGPGSVGIEL